MTGEKQPFSLTGPDLLHGDATETDSESEFRWLLGKPKNQLSTEGTVPLQIRPICRDWGLRLS